MLKNQTIMLSCIVVLFTAAAGYSKPLIVCHKAAKNFHDIPDCWIEKAKSELHIAYQHTSHGSQLVSGMNALKSFPAFGKKYDWSDSGEAGALDFDDFGIPGIPTTKIFSR